MRGMTRFGVVLSYGTQLHTHKLGVLAPQSFENSIVHVQEDDGGRTVKVEVSLLVLRLPAGVKASPPHPSVAKPFIPEDLTSTSFGELMTLCSVCDSKRLP